MKTKMKKMMKNMEHMGSSKKGIVTGLFLSLFLLILTASPSDAEVHIVKIKEFNFHPADLTVMQGDTVLWVNEMPYGHWVISGTDIRHDNNYFSPLLLKEHKFSYTFKDAMVQDYYCPIHSMQGRVTVLEGEKKVSEDKPEKTEKKKRRRRRSRD